MDRFSSTFLHSQYHSEIATCLRAVLRVTCALATGAAVVRAEEVKSFKINELQPGSRFQFATADHVYRAELVDPTTGETRLAASADGSRFSEPRTVFLLGATQGRQAQAGGLMFVKMNQVQTGLRLELGVGSLDERDRAVTEPVQSIRMD